VKTAISVPDGTFESVTRRARQLGISRSEFFSVAARRYLQELDRASLTEQINQALDAVGLDDSSRAAVTAGRRRLATSEDW
jgi:metal-responsive CopG/Arc/MetJ family transcriptional regulator